MKLTGFLLIAAAALLLVEGSPWRSQPGVARDGDGHKQALRIESPARSTFAYGTTSTSTTLISSGSTRVPR